MTFKIKDILNDFGDCKFYGNLDVQLETVEAISSLDNGKQASTISWLSDKNLDKYTDHSFNLGLLILSPKAYEILSHNKSNFLVSPNPRQTFQRLLDLKFKKRRPSKIESTAQVAESARIGKNCYIGHHVAIEENVIIGENCIVLHNTTILANTVIGNNVEIGCNNTIGNYGFGYEKNTEGRFELIQHIGNVVIKDNVWIHNNTCIDRAMIGSTILEEDVKIDNLVHIAHGVVIGKNSVVIANSMIAGSTKIGSNCWVAPSASVLNKLTIGDNSLIGIGAVVLKNVEESSKVVGNPGKVIGQTREN